MLIKLDAPGRVYPALEGALPRRGFIPVNSNDCQTPNKLTVFLKRERDFGVFIILIYACVSFKQVPAASACTNVAPARAALHLIPLVAVFVRVVPSAQPVPSGLRWSRTGSPLFRCAQVSLRRERGARIAHTAR